MESNLLNAMSYDRATSRSRPVATLQQEQSLDWRNWRKMSLFGLPPTVLRDAAAIFIISRLFFVTFSALIVIFANHASFNLTTFLTAWSHWDARLFVGIANDGYLPGLLCRTPFFPLLPLIMHLLGPLVGGNYYLAGIIVANVSFFFALLGLAALAYQESDAATARRAMLYLTLFPSAFFLFAGYTEALFLAFAIWDSSSLLMNEGMVRTASIEEVNSVSVKPAHAAYSRR